MQSRNLSAFPIPSSGLSPPCSIMRTNACASRRSTRRKATKIRRANSSRRSTSQKRSGVFSGKTPWAKTCCDRPPFFSGKTPTTDFRVSPARCRGRIDRAQNVRTSPTGARRNPETAFQLSVDPRISLRSSGLLSLHRPDIDLRLQRAVHRAFVGDLQQPCALLGIEVAIERDGALDVVDHAFLGLTGGAIGGVDAAVPQAHRGLLERQLLALGIKAQRHRRAGAEPGEQKIVRAWAAIHAADRYRLIGEQPMAADNDLLLKFAAPRFAHQ